MASMLEMNTPKLNGTTIGLTFPNETLKLELERAQFPLMEYLRKALKNFDLTLDISVNEEAAKQYAFTPIEKYEKLKEKTLNIELLKKPLVWMFKLKLMKKILLLLFITSIIFMNCDGRKSHRESLQQAISEFNQNKAAP
ncbi:MAG: hypothetical protein R2812_06625 [Gelidibacter sp.]